MIVGLRHFCFIINFLIYEDVGATNLIAVVNQIFIRVWGICHCNLLIKKGR